ncbi:MAG: DUF29 domain-containing protein [Methylohalobius crimeensis]
MTGTRYEADVVAWAREQARLLRAGRFDDLDIEHIAEEIEDVGKSEQRELASRMVVLLAHLLKWRYQSERRGNSWRRTIKVQRKDIAYLLKESPSLKGKFNDSEWMDLIWEKAAAQAATETELDVFPEANPWTIGEILDFDWFPDC